MKIRLPRLSRKLTRLPRGAKPKNPFKAGTSAMLTRLKRARNRIAAAAAASNLAPGGAIGATLGGLAAGPTGAAAAGAAGWTVDTAATALLARGALRRQRIANYLARRKKRTTGVYKALQALSEAIRRAHA